MEYLSCKLLNGSLYFTSGSLLNVANWMIKLHQYRCSDRLRLLLLIMKISRTTWPLELSNYTQSKSMLDQYRWYDRSSDSEIFESISCHDNGDTQQIVNVSLGKSRALIFEIIYYRRLTSWNFFYVILFKLNFSCKPMLRYVWVGFSWGFVSYLLKLILLRTFV